MKNNIRTAALLFSLALAFSVQGATDVIGRARAATVLVLTDRAAGSGFVVSSDGFIVTNRHVVEDAESVVAFLQNREKFRAKVVFKGDDTDMAILKVEAPSPLTTLEVGDSSQLSIGSSIAAVGYPLVFDLLRGGMAPEASVAFGQVSGIRKSLQGKMMGSRELIQIDARLNHGNSGGPLIDLNSGKVVGMNTWSHGIVAGGDSLNFAIPSAAIFVALKNQGISLSQKADFNEVTSQSAARMSDLLLLSRSNELSSLWFSSVDFPWSFTGRVERSLAVYFAATGQFPSLVSAPISSGSKLWATSVTGQIVQYDEGSLTDPVKVILNDESQAFFNSPVLGDASLFAFSGRLGFFSGVGENKSWGAAFTGQTMRLKATLSGSSTLYSIDPLTSAVKWSQPTVFLSGVRELGGKLLVAGLGGYALLDSGTGNVTWTQGSEGRNEEHPHWFIIAGLTSEKALVLDIPLRISNKPEDLEEGDVIAAFGNGKVRLVSCDLKNGKTTDIIDVASVGDFRRAMNASARLSADGTTAYTIVGPYMFAIDLKKKQTLWHQALSSSDEIEKNKGRSALLFNPNFELSEGKLYVGGADEKLHCFDAKSGVEKWTISTRGSVGGPTVLKGHVYFGTASGWLSSADASTGELLWRTKVDPISEPPIVTDQFITAVSKNKFRLLRGLNFDFEK